MNYNKLKGSIKESGIGFEKLAEKIDMTPQGLRAAMNNDTMSINVLERICKIIKVPVVHFLDENTSKNPSPKIETKLLQEIRTGIEDIALCLGIKDGNTIQNNLRILTEIIEKKS